MNTRLRNAFESPLLAALVGAAVVAASLTLTGDLSVGGTSTFTGAVTAGSLTTTAATTLGNDTGDSTIVNGYQYSVGQANNRFQYFNLTGTNYGVAYNSSGKLRFGGAASVGGAPAVESFEIDPNSAAATVLGTFQTNAGTSIGNEAADVLDVNGDLSVFATTGGEGATYIYTDSVNFGYSTNGVATGYLNYNGYLNSTGQFRTLVVADGKHAAIATFTGSDKSVAFAGNVTNGDANTDAATVWGHKLTRGTAPSLSSCGGSPAIDSNSNDQAGNFTPNTTTCTLTFSRTYTNKPACVLFREGNATGPTCTVSATAITCTTIVSGSVYHYLCSGIGSGAT